MVEAVSRRGLLASFGVVAAGGCAGLTGGGGETTTDGDDTSTPSVECTATDPPAPSAAATTPKPYPAGPGNLTAETARAFAEAYERAYQFNDQLEEHPDKLGRTNDLDTSIYETTVKSTANGFRVILSGQRNWGFINRNVTPETPTETPLPQGHRPFETTYLVTDRFLRRNGVTVECW